MNDKRNNFNYESNDWASWSLYIIKTIEKLQNKTEELENQSISINLELQKEIIRLKTYAKVISIISALISSLVVSILGGYIVYVLSTNTISKTPDNTKTQQENIIKRSK